MSAQDDEAGLAAEALILIRNVKVAVGEGRVTDAHYDAVEAAMLLARVIGCATDAEVAASKRCIDVAMLDRVLRCLGPKGRPPKI